MLRLGSILLLLLSALPHPLFSAVDFEKEIAPILRSSCLGCHSARAGMGNVRLHAREAMEVKSSLGVIVAPGDPQKSALFLSLLLPKGNPKAMPPTGPLPAEKRELIRQWILEGAKWPDGFSFDLRPPATARAKAEAAPLKDDLELVKAAGIRIREKSQEQDEASMKPYAEPIPATDVSLDFVPIPGGAFAMGTPDSEAGRGEDETPVHRVQVDPFWMSKFETTWDAYRLFMFATEANEAQNPDTMVAATSRPTAPYVEMSFGMGLNGYPAISMTQHAANKFAQWLSLKTGHFYRLPTEAEWEYACRAGSSTAYSFGDDPAQLAEYAWFSTNSEDKYQQVGKKKPNPWGLYDMHGNVMEWTLDAHSTDFYGEGGALAMNPWNRGAEPYPHVARGGGWMDGPALLRCGARMPSDPSWKIQDPQLPKSIWYHTDAQSLGFRLVRPLKVPSAEEIFRYWNNGVEYD
ncbi:MAG: SUMF1/EgtB/PvdO family nonheme iron enzyme [Bryobacterales bacterium]|nr:SUMF1/EgtB/PvdO family nonheme iron enzyme [Bryobacterales bacterium]